MTFHRRLPAIVFCAISLFACPLGVRAGLVTWQFSGNVTHVVDDAGLLGGQVSYRTPFSGSFTFDPDTPDSDAHPRRGVYEDAVTNIAGQIGPITFAASVTPPGWIRVQNDFGSSSLDEFEVFGNVELAPGVPVHFSIYMSDREGTILNADALLSTALPLEELEDATMSVLLPEGGPTFVVQGPLATLVPEPSAGLLLLLGTWVVVGRRRVCAARCIRRGVTQGKARYRIHTVLVRIGICMLECPYAFGEDCNGNAVVDAYELQQPCRLEIVAVVDTSPSMDDASHYLRTACERIDEAITALVQEGIIPSKNSVEKLTIATSGLSVPCPCCNGDVPKSYGRTASGWMLSALGSCGSDIDGAEEDWPSAACPRC